MLGVTFHVNLKNLSDLNFVPKLEKLKSTLRIWSMRDMTPIGKITIVKTLGLPQLIYLFSVLPKPNDDFLKELDTVLYKFIWSNKPDKVSRKTLVGDYQDGGLKMMHIPSMIKGLKGALDKFNIIPQLFPKKVEIFIPLEVLAWVMTACRVLRSRLTYF